MEKRLVILMSAPPGPESQFVEAEDENGKGVDFGTWEKGDDGYWRLVFAERDLLRFLDLTVK